MRKKHDLQFYSNVYRLKPLKQRPFDFDIVQFNQDTVKGIDLWAKSVEKIIHKRYEDFRNAFLNKKEIDHKCLVHKKTVEAICLD